MVFLLSLALLLSTLGAPARAATPAESVARLVSAGELDRARHRCDKLGAEAAGADGALREICAEAWWPLTEAEDTAAAWVRFQQRWQGTSRVGEAREEEARAVFRTVNRDDEAALLDFARRYPGTGAASGARELAAYLAFHQVYTPEQALAVAREFPDHPDTPALMERFPAAFVEVEVAGTELRPHMVQGFSAPAGRELSARWVARLPDRSLLPWDELARRQLEEQGLNPSRLASSDSGRAFPLCYDPLAPEGTSAGVEVRLGRGSAFFEQPWDEGCGEDAWPVFLVSRGSALVALSTGPEQLLSLPSRPAPEGAVWGHGVTLSGVWVPCSPGAPVAVPGAHLLGQQCGSLYLVHPLSGGLPWLTSMAPPASALPLGAATGTQVLPRSWALQPAEGGGSRIYGPASAEGEWTLPPGEVRVLTPLAQGLLGLTPEDGPEEEAPVLPASADGFWQRRGVDLAPGTPTGARPLDWVALDPEAASQAVEGLPGVEAVRGWAVQLDEDAPVEEVVEAHTEEARLIVVHDRYASGAGRWFVVVEPLVQGSTEAFAFTWEGHAYVAWTGRLRGVSRVVALHFDARGLVREQQKVGR